VADFESAVRIYARQASQVRSLDVTIMVKACGVVHGHGFLNEVLAKAGLYEHGAQQVRGSV
jgi:hypothetical protein